MISEKTALQQQKGAVLVLVALGLLMLMGVAALAIDLSHAYTNKTRLQNLADALALSAAISMNKGSTDTVSETYARTNTLPQFKAGSGNTEVSDAITSNTSTSLINFTFATSISSTATDWHAASGSTAYKFVRVVVSPTNFVSTWFANIIGFSNVAVSSTAVAGFIPIVPCDNVLPIIACAKNGNTDTDCSDGACYGYQTNTVFCFKTNATDSGCPDVTSDYTGLINGNFGWMDVGTGGKSVKDCAAGDLDCVSTFCSNIAAGNSVSGQTGNITSVHQAFNTRFDTYQGSYNHPDLYPPDKYVGGTASSTSADNSTRSDGLTLSPSASWSSISIPAIAESGLTATNLYDTYYQSLVSSNASSDATHTYQDNRRVLAVPFIDCSAVTKSGGTFTVPASALIGFGCAFITQPMPTSGSTNFIYAEITDGTCIASGKITSLGNSGLYKVILYKDPFSGHS